MSALSNVSSALSRAGSSLSQFSPVRWTLSATIRGLSKRHPFQTTLSGRTLSWTTMLRAFAPVLWTYWSCSFLSSSRHLSWRPTTLVVWSTVHSAQMAPSMSWDQHRFNWPSIWVFSSSTLRRWFYPIWCWWLCWWHLATPSQRRTTRQCNVCIFFSFSWSLYFPPLVWTRKLTVSVYCLYST